MEQITEQEKKKWKLVAEEVLIRAGRDAYSLKVSTYANVETPTEKDRQEARQFLQLKNKWFIFWCKVADISPHKFVYNPNNRGNFA